MILAAEGNEGAALPDYPGGGCATSTEDTAAPSL
jgi:hypothetical protein